MQSTAPDPDLHDAEEHTGGVRLRRELLIFACACLAGLMAPLLIYAVGHSALGPYNRGGPGRLLADFMTGLAHGSPIFWTVALGPYVLTLLTRFLHAQVRGWR